MDGAFSIEYLPAKKRKKNLFYTFCFKLKLKLKDSKVVNLNNYIVSRHNNHNSHKYITFSDLLVKFLVDL